MKTQMLLVWFECITSIINMLSITIRTKYCHFSIDNRINHNPLTVIIDFIHSRYSLGIKIDTELNNETWIPYLKFYSNNI